MSKTGEEYLPRGVTPDSFLWYKDASAAGNVAVYDKIVEAAVLFDKGNEALKIALDEFGKE